MGLIEKIEIFINQLLISFGRMLIKIISKFIPVRVMLFWNKILSLKSEVVVRVKSLPQLMRKLISLLLMKIKKTKDKINFLENFKKTYLEFLSPLRAKHSGQKFYVLKLIFMFPAEVVANWLRGLGPIQSLMLMGFTFASILAAINIVSSGQRLIGEQSHTSRSPANTQPEVIYERPEYYKKETKHLDLTNLKLPVFFANLNELRTIDIDFNLTLSNRMSRMQLAKLEFQLRDHLILNVEPMQASFPLLEEGKNILREKLLVEINQFMKNREIDGEVVELKLIYILAN